MSKFKVWDSKDKIWYDDHENKGGFYINPNGRLHIFYSVGINVKASNRFIPVFSTGKTDKDDVELFDGDYIEEGLIFYSNDYLGFFVDTGTNELDDVIKPLYDIPLPKKIGSKYENPELMEGESGT